MALSLALSRCNKTSIRRLEFGCCSGMDDEAAAELINALATHRNMRNLTLGFSNNAEKWLGGASGCALGNLLRKSPSKLEELDLGRNKIDDEGATALANGLAASRTSALKKLYLQENPNITTTGWKALFTSLSSHASSLEALDASNNNIRCEAFNIRGSGGGTRNTKLKDLNLGYWYDDFISSAEWGPHFNRFLTNMSSLKNLNLSHESHITTAVGWRALFNTLQTHNYALEHLNLGGSNIDDDVVNTMVDALANMSSLKSLGLCSNTQITTLGWRAIASLNSSLEELFLIMET